MKSMLVYIKFTGLIILMAFLFAFTTKRNHKRMISEVKIEFIEEQNPYVDELMVNKLLIQNHERVTSVGKEILVLNTVERELDAHEMIEDSNVYLTVNGELKVRIKQRTPIARVNAVTPFYVGAKGGVMPLSDNYSAHVPLVYNVSEREVVEVYPLLKIIQEDEFLKKQVVSVTKNEKKEFELGMRTHSFNLILGKVEDLKSKIRNFKAFYQKALKDQSLDHYKIVSLQFSNQVVCTKK